MIPGGDMDSQAIVTLFVIISVGAAFITGIFVRSALRRVRHQRLRRQPFPSEWQAILEKHLQPYDQLSAEMRRELHGLIHVFLSEKHFEGCGGLAITDEIRVTVAAQACLLLLNRPTDVYPRLDTVVLYPTAYIDREGGSVRLGESWTRAGVVVLAWDHVKGGMQNFENGRNVTLHEFAHQLDQEDGSADGAPILAEPSAYRTWAQVLGEEYAALQKKVRKRRRTVVDRYGATHPAEFFAEATVAFFEKGRTLRRRRPELYEELKSYYRQDPAEW
jgi:Mlc titration factor MtfA (ptsG expression regulator)